MRNHIVSFSLWCGLLLFTMPVPFPVIQADQLQVLDAQNLPLTSFVDGKKISLKLVLAKPISVNTTTDFFLEGVPTSVSTCVMSSGQNTCQTPLFSTLGWAWDGNGKLQPQRVVQAKIASQTVAATPRLSITPRPVVMVHGFNSNWKAWESYLGAKGYLASVGLKGYAVGDGQVAGVMNTGDLEAAPTTPTNSIAQNAEILKDYIGNVQKITNAEQVDLLVHSMGGMISRYYLDRLMSERNVAQLIILGTPMGGSSCASLPAALGLALPATIEIQPSYMQNIFNPQITKRHGVPFNAVAGNQLLEAVRSPCTAVPSDLVVTVSSVKAIAMPVQEITLLHGDLKTSPEVFEKFVRPLLQTLPGKFVEEPDPAPLAAPAPVQFSRVYTGHVSPGVTQSVTINIDPNVTVANFALYDTSRSLSISVTGANGNVLQIDPAENGEIRVTDPSSLVYLGYGFKSPRPGQWIITLRPTATTPAAGANYALAAQFNGGATLQATLDKVVPQVNESVLLKAILIAPDQAATISNVQAVMRLPDGKTQTYPLSVQGDAATVSLTSSQSGLHGLEVNLTAKTSAGLIIDRAVFLSFNVQPTANDVSQNLWLISLVAGLVLALIMGGMFFLWRRWKNRKI